MEKYIKPVMDVVECTDTVGTFSICTSNQAVTSCAGGVLSFGGGGGECDR